MSARAGGGYVDLTTLSSIALGTRSQYSSFGGVMLWDASQAYANRRFDQGIKNAIREDGNGGTTRDCVHHFREHDHAPRLHTLDRHDHRNVHHRDYDFCLTDGH
ncbi:hypothetical protein L226DRAFT_540817 [Lentinus tigrinus ALCF2SS1-7]|uniref:GH18 domain-containing protein n=1 Tax=Lentinus tigrinus ALCF2SS1-6 TaxID=1328759 RepID=A0A5C2RP42_9APHY|nr:hypothetical protein L227DRAFT_581672 [Lentinus tigrinus ALCF2SS1-6]RPD68278.1 hypothetical protein L226DRAFT_540817 [Lentinus tigrinus ALCF2SS1-7]